MVETGCSDPQLRVLRTQRLDLCRIGKDDVDTHLNCLNSAAVMAQLGGPRSREDIIEKHAKARASFAADGFGFMFAYERVSGELVAHCGMKRVDIPQAANLGDHEIGWLVREDRWRRGYAEEAVRAIMQWGFETHRAPHIVALTSEENLGSRRLMEKLGMQRRKDLDIPAQSGGEPAAPIIQYSLTRNQWEGMQ